MAGDGLPGQRPARFRDVFAVGQFRVLWLAQGQSWLGDQLAKVALSVLVFERTGSSAWTALTYAMTILPNLAGGALLAGLADRFSRRAVIVVADVVRAVLVGVMALPGAPIVVLVVLLCAVQLPYAPASAARTAILPAMLSGDRFVVGIAVMRTTDQLGQVVGFAVGATVVALVGTHVALVADAATFALSALLISFGVRAHRPPAAEAVSTGGVSTGGVSAGGVSAGGVSAGGGRSVLAVRAWWASVRAGAMLVWTDRRLRALVGLACINGFYIIPEGIAVPYAAQIHGGTPAVGWLLAAIPVGSVIGMTVLKSLRPEWRLRLMGPLAVATCLVLLPTAWAPVLVVSVLVWALSGLFSAHDMIVNTTFVQITPDAARGQALGLASAMMQTAQGLGIVVAGLLAGVWTPALVVGLAAVTGAVAAGAAAARWRSAWSGQPHAGLADTTAPDQAAR